MLFTLLKERESKWQTALSCLLSCRRWLFLAATSRIILGEPFAKCFGCYRDPVYFVGKTLNISPWHPSLCTVVGDGRVWHSSPVVCWMQLRVFHFAGSSIIWICPSTVIIGVVVGSREGRQAGRAGQLFTVGCMDLLILCLVAIPLMSVLLYLLSWKWPSDYKGVALFLFRLACLRRISNRVVADCCDFCNILEKTKNKMSIVFVWDYCSRPGRDCRIAQSNPLAEESASRPTGTAQPWT